MKGSRTDEAHTASVVTNELPTHGGNLIAAVLKGIATRDRERFREDLVEIFYAESEAHSLRAFWELAARWERLYPTVVEMIERKLHGASSVVASR